MHKIVGKPRGPVSGKRIARRVRRASRFRAPNAETRAAIEELRRGDLPVFHSVEELMADLDAEDLAARDRTVSPAARPRYGPRHRAGTRGEAGMSLDFTGKRAIVTAGGGGIGRETALAFAEGGARVFVCDIDEDALSGVLSAHDNIAGMVTDVSDPAALDALFARADEYLGGLDIMVNNAGTAGPTAAIEDVALEDWRACVDVNLTAAFLGTQRALPRLKAAGGGSIVNLSSAAGKFGFAHRSPYVASKWAIVGLTRTTALEAGPHNIRCNCIQPGSVEGARIDRVIRAKAEVEGVSENLMRDRFASVSSLRRFVPPRHIAGMILYLCADIGSTITGQAISVDAGLEGLA